MTHENGRRRIKKWRRIVFILVAVGMYYLISYSLHPNSIHWKGYFSHPIEYILLEWVISLVFCFLVSEASIFISRWLNRWLPWTERTLSRAVLQSTLQIICVIIIIAFQIGISFVIDGCSFEQLQDDDLIGIWNWVSGSIIIGLMISAINTGSYLIESWRETAMEAAAYKLRAAEHKQAAVEAELQALKLQIDPHFVFNNLSVLSELILESQQLGYEYAENFSKVYRYLLVNSKKDLISLEDELKFLHAYIFLINHRMGEGVTFRIDISPELYKQQLLPLTLQLLIENALKHNKTSKNDPLNIRVYSNAAGELVVENTLIPLQGQVPSPGIGLHNIISRYRLLTNNIPVIIDGPDTYQVIIPLIKP